MAPADRQTLTVAVITYNHQDYIAEALESVALQEGVEIDRIVVSDDHSSDRTVAVARETAERLGMKVEIVESAEQMGISPHYRKLFSGLDTELAAILEGDDYWFDRRKLARQLELLHEYPFTSACSMSYLLFDQTTKSMTTKRCESGALSVLGTAQIVQGGDGFCFSNMVYRIDALKRIPDEFYDLKSYDWIVNILVSRDAPIIHLDVPGIVHRLSSSGAWASLGEDSKLETLVEVIDSYLPHVDAFTRGLLESKRDEVAGMLARMRAPEPEPAPAPAPTFARRLRSAAKALLGR